VSATGAQLVLQSWFPPGIQKRPDASDDDDTGLKMDKRKATATGGERIGVSVLRAHFTHGQGLKFS
jgi:hypothetical protein